MILKTTYKMKPPLSARLNYSPPPGDNLIAFYLMNEGSGLTVRDLFGRGPPGTFRGTAPSWSYGKFGPAVLLPGDDEYIDFGTNVETFKFGKGNFTISVLFKGLGDGIASPALFGARLSVTSSRYALSVFDASGRLRFSIFDDDGMAVEVTPVTTNYLDNEWHHAIVVIDRSNGIVRMYVEGAQIGSDIDISSLTGDVSPRGIVVAGAYVFGSPVYLEGTIDSILVYGRALVASEVKRLYRNLFCMFERRRYPPISLPA